MPEILAAPRSDPNFYLTFHQQSQNKKTILVIILSPICVLTVIRYLKYTNMLLCKNTKDSQLCTLNKLKNVKTTLNTMLKKITYKKTINLLPNTITNVKILTMFNNIKTTTKIFHNTKISMKKCSLHTNSFAEIKRKLDVGEHVTEVENEYLKSILEYTQENIKNGQSFSDIMFLSTSDFGHIIHPESFVEILGVLYESMLVSLDEILIVDDLGFYDYNGMLQPNYIEIFDNYVEDLNKELGFSAKSETSSDISDDLNLDLDDVVNPWGFGSFIFYGFIITLIFGLFTWFKLKFKKVNLETKQEEDQQHSIFEMFNMDYNVKMKFLLLFVPSCMIILYMFRYYYYYNVKILFHKCNILSSKNICKKSIHNLRHFNNLYTVLGSVYSCTKTPLVQKISLKIIKRYHGPIKKTVEKCVGLACNSTRPFMEALPKNTPKPINKNAVSSNVKATPEKQLPVPKQKLPIQDATLKRNFKDKPVSFLSERRNPSIPPNNTNSSLNEDIIVDNALNNLQKSRPLNTQALQLLEKQPVELQTKNIPATTTVKQDIQTQEDAKQFHENKHPSDLHKKQMASIVNTLAEKKEYQKQEQAGNSVNLIPSKLKNINKKEYQPIPPEKTNADNISAETMLKHCVDRALVIVDNNPTINPEFKKVDIKLANGSTQTLNNGTQGIKLTDIGNAYAYQHKESKKTTPEEINTTKIMLETRAIIAPPTPGKNVLVANGKTNHLMYGCYTSEGDFMASIYFTSKKSGEKLSNKQYKIFEEEQEKQNNSTDKKEKAQHGVKFNKGTLICKEDIRPVKYSEEYLATLEEDVQEFLNKAVLMHSKTSLITYEDSSGLTKEDCFDICKQYDETAAALSKNPKTSKKHPLSPEQQKLNEENKHKQKEYQKLKYNINQSNDEIS